MRRYIVHVVDLLLLNERGSEMGIGSFEIFGEF